MNNHSLDLMEAQLELEKRSTIEGYDRYTKQQDTKATHEGDFATTEASTVIRGCIPLVSKEISRWLENQSQQKGKTHKAVAILKRFDPDTLAFIALNNVYTGCNKSASITRVMGHIGTTLENECIALDLEASRGRKVAERIKAQVSKQGSANNRRKAFLKLADAKGNEWERDLKVKAVKRRPKGTPDRRPKGTPWRKV